MYPCISAHQRNVAHEVSANLWYLFKSETLDGYAWLASACHPAQTQTYPFWQIYVLHIIQLNWKHLWVAICLILIDTDWNFLPRCVKVAREGLLTSEMSADSDTVAPRLKKCNFHSEKSASSRAIVPPVATPPPLCWHFVKARFYLRPHFFNFSSGGMIGKGVSDSPWV